MADSFAMDKTLLASTAYRQWLSAAVFALSAMTSFAQSPTAPASPRPLKLFVSGHSLTDMPYPAYLASVGQSLGTPIDWQRQYLVGSSIKDRARGRGRETGWAGYSAGDNREGSGLNVIQDLKTTPYDVLLITEQHGLIDALIWHDTVRHLRHYHDRFIDGQPRGRTLFYEPWLGIPGRTEFERWVRYERSAAPVWRCVVARVNDGLAKQGRADRVESLPAALALAELVERATRQPGVPGITEADASSTLKKLFRDDVHLNPLGFYYLALVSQGFLTGKTLQGAWHPAEVSATQAQSLQNVATEFVARYRKEVQQPQAKDCAEALNGAFLEQYFDHRRDEYWAQVDESAMKKTWQRLRSEATLRWRLFRQKPLTWNNAGPATDEWFGPP
jgi:hypothetical protein